VVLGSWSYTGTKSGQQLFVVPVHSADTRCGVIPDPLGIATRMN